MTAVLKRAPGTCTVRTKERVSRTSSREEVRTFDEQDFEDAYGIWEDAISEGVDLYDIELSDLDEDDLLTVSGEAFCLDDECPQDEGSGPSNGGRTKPSCEGDDCGDGEGSSEASESADDCVAAEQEDEGGQASPAVRKASPGCAQKVLGMRGEDAAALFLERRGYEVIERNWRCPAGEADIVARDEDGTVVFVEVKARSGVRFGFPEEAVTSVRRRRYERIAGYYLSDHVFEDARVRFDIVAILVLEPSNRLYIRHHINAFGSDFC